jgi:hypothetical protein
MTEENIKSGLKKNSSLFLVCVVHNVRDTVETCPSGMYGKVESTPLSDNEI